MIDCVAGIAAQKGIVESTLGPMGPNSQKKCKKKNLYYYIFIIYYFLKYFLT